MTKTGDGVLTQAEIDALITKSASPAISNPTSQASNNTQSQNMVDNQPASSEVKNAPLPLMNDVTPNQPSATKASAYGDPLTNILVRLTTLENAVRNLQGQTIQKDPMPNYKQMVDQLSQQVGQLNSQVRLIVEGLKATASYNIGKNFKCSCGSTGMVGIRVRCNVCGKESWFGWFPSAKPTSKRQ